MRIFLPTTPVRMVHIHDYIGCGQAQHRAHSALIMFLGIGEQDYKYMYMHWGDLRTECQITKRK